MNHHHHALLEALEPRILYSADLAAVLGSAVDAAGASAEAAPAAAHMQLVQSQLVQAQLVQSQGLQAQGLQAQPVQPAQPTHATAQAFALHELAFVDLAVPDAQSLLAGLAAQRDSGRLLDIVTIAADEDGLAVISHALQAWQDGGDGQPLGAVHLFSHGSAGQVQLGHLALDGSTALQRAGELAAWGSALGADADLLIYGCDVASTAAGQDLLAALAALTGADTAASTDATGAAARGGNWLLEATSGSVETPLAVDAQLQQSWPGLLGTEFTVNTTTNNNQHTDALGRGSQQAVAVDAEGNYVVVWTSQNQDGDGDGVFARRFAWDGTPLSGEIAVNTSTAGDQNQARVAADDAGNFVVVWASSDGGSAGSGIFMRTFAANGTAAGAQTAVDTAVAGNQYNPVLGMDRATGNFVVAWEGQNGADSAGIAFRRYTAAGVPLDATQRAGNTSDTGSEIGPAVAMDGTGRVVVAYETNNHMHFQRFDSSGNAAGARTQVDNALSNSTGAAIAMDAAGNFTLAYREEGSLAPGVWGRGYLADGSQRYTWYYADTGDADSPSLAMADDGAFVVTYQKTGVDGIDIYARRYTAAGAADGAAFAVNAYTSVDQMSPSVALLGSQDFVVVWSGKAAGDSAGVSARTFEAAAAAPVITSNGGGASASQAVVDGSTAVTTVTATDSNLPAQTLQFSISGGTDSSHFVLDSQTGALRFATAPTVAAPTDSDGNNSYAVRVRASDGVLFDDQDLVVTVLPLAQGPLSVADSYTLQEDQALNANLASGWYDAAWTLRQAITLDNSSGPALTDTVVLVTLDASTVDHSRTQDGGQDLRFVSSSGQLLAHEIEVWDEAGTSGVWVRVPSIAAASSSGSLWMYSGNPTAADGQQVAQTWPAGTSAVVHMGSTLADATANGNAVTQSGTTVSTGAVGQARLFDGTASWVGLGSAAALDDLFLGGGTFSAWFNPSTWGEGGYGRIASKADTTFAAGANGNGWNLELNGPAQSLLFEVGFGSARGGWVTPAGSVSLNTWQHVSVVYDNSSAANSPRMFINGVEVATTRDGTPSGAPTSDAAVPLRLGNQALTTDRAFAGRIDEVRVQDSALTPAQVSTLFRGSSGALASAPGVAQQATPGVLNNDDPRSGGAITAELLTGPAHASSFTLNGDGTFSYQPTADYFGADSFSYRAVNSTVAGDAVTVSLAITNAADAPVFTAGGGAASTTASVAEGTTAVATLGATDADGSGTVLAWSITGGADALHFVVDSATGALRFAAAPAFATPTDSGADNRYDVVVQVSDGVLHDTLALAVSVTDVPAAPVATADSYAVNRDSVLTVPINAGLLANDSDADGNPLQVLAVGVPAHGSVSLTPAALTPFVNLSNHPAVDTRPAWSPTGALVAFDSARTGDNEIYVMAASGGSATRLTNHSADDSQAAWSPDGSRIAFMSNRDGNYDLWLMNAADGSGLVQLAATASGVSGQPSWSPDGTRIAFTSDRGGSGFDIYTVNADGSGLLRLTTAAGNDDEPAWSADGTRIAHTSARDGNAEIYVMNADGSGQTRLASHAGLDRTPDWSPDGRTLSFISDRTGLPQIALMDANGANAVTVTEDPAGVGFADWSGSGTRFVFTQGGNEVQVADLVYPGGFIYSPAPGYAGSDSFSYTVGDGTGRTANATVTITVQGAAIAAQNDSASTPRDTAVTVDVLANDVAGPGGPLQLLDVATPSQGSAVVAGNQLLYTPSAGYTGSDSTRYLVADAAQQLAHYWRLDGDALDATGTAHGVLVNGPTATAGVYGSALQFDGTNRHVQLPDVAYNGEFTLSFWFKLANNTGTGYRYLYSHGDVAAPHSLNVFFIEDATATPSGAQDVLRTRLRDANDADDLNGLDIAAAPLADNQWHQYTLTTSAGSGARVYVDGLLRASIASGGDALNPAGSARLGSDSTLSAQRFLTGSLDGVALYGRSLDSTEVMAQASGGARSATLALTVSALVQTPPVITSNGGGTTALATVAENRTGVTTVQASDSDVPAQALAYSVSGGADAAQFQIDPGTGVLTFRTAPDFEAPADVGADGNYEVTVQASDGVLAAQQMLVVRVTDANEFSVSTPVDTNPQANAVAEDAAMGDTVGLALQAADADGSQNTVSYSLDDSAGGRFTIDSANGLVRVAAALDAETASSHTVTVRATSADGSWSLGSFNIAVSDSNEFALGALTDTDAAPNTVLETATPGTPVGLTARAVDADASNPTVTYTLADSAGGRFAIDAQTGVVSLARGLGEAGLASHAITVQAQSSDGSVSSQAYTIDIGWVNNHPPVITSAGGAASARLLLDEGQTTVGLVAASDADLPPQPLQYLLAGGADVARFSIDAASGSLRLRVAPDFEAPDDANGDGVYDVVVAASDGALQALQTLAVQLRNVDEAPQWLAHTLVVSEGSTARPGVLLADMDTPPALLQLQVQGLGGGHFEHQRAPGVAVTVFTQADLQAGAITFVADGGEAAPAYQLVLADASTTLPPRAADVSFTPVNDAPVFTSPQAGASLLPVAENTTAVITLQATDADSPAGSLRYRVAAGDDAALFSIDPVSGALRFTSAPDHERPVDADGNGRYELVLAASDGTATTLQPLTLTVADTDEAPVLARQALLLSDDGIALQLQATDPEGRTAQLNYEVLSTQGGRFEWTENTAQPGAVATRFSQADVDAQRVRFAATGSTGAATPGFSLALSDGLHRMLLGAPDIVRVPSAPPWPPVQAPAPPTAEPTATDGTATPAALAWAPATAAAANGAAVAAAAGPAAETPTLAVLNTAPLAAPLALESHHQPNQADTPGPANPLAPTAGAFWATALAPLGWDLDTAPLLHERTTAALLGGRGSTSLAQAMDATRASDEDPANTALELGSAGTVLVSSGLSVGYVLWLARGGVLAASLMSSVPAWASVDPLPVLAQMRKGGSTDGDGGDGSDDAAGDDFDPIERLFSRARRLLPGAPAAEPTPPADPAPAAAARTRPAHTAAHAAAHSEEGPAWAP